MATLISLAIIIFIFYRIFTATDRKFDKRMAPPGMKIDWSNLNQDLANGKSQTEVKDKYNRGEYDIPCDNGHPLYKYRKR